MTITRQINLTVTRFSRAPSRLQAPLSDCPVSPIAGSFGLRTGETSGRTGDRLLRVGRQKPSRTSRITRSAFLRAQSSESDPKELQSSEPCGTSSRYAQSLSRTGSATQNPAAASTHFLRRRCFRFEEKSPLSYSSRKASFDHAQFMGCKRQARRAAEVGQR